MIPLKSGEPPQKEKRIYKKIFIVEGFVLY